MYHIQVSHPVLQLKDERFEKLPFWVKVSFYVGAMLLVVAVVPFVVATLPVIAVIQLVEKFWDASRR